MGISFSRFEKLSFLIFVLFCFGCQVSLCNTNWPGTHSVEQACFVVTNIHLPLPLGLLIFKTVCYDAQPLCYFIENIFYAFSVIVSFYFHNLQVRSFLGILLSLHIYFRISQLTSALSSKPRVSIFLWSIPLVRLSTKVYVWLIEFCIFSIISVGLFFSSSLSVKFCFHILDCILYFIHVIVVCSWSILCLL